MGSATPQWQNRSSGGARRDRSPVHAAAPGRRTGVTVNPKRQQAIRARSPQPDAVTGGQAVWETLARLGVTHVFGYPGGAILPTYDALPASGISHVLVRHEQSAAHMADGYARATGRVGVAMATSGPGA